MNTVLKAILILMLIVTPAWGGVDFDGDDDTIVASDGSVFDFDNTQSFSFSLWFKTDGDTQRQTLIDKRDNLADGYGCWIETTGLIEFFINSQDNRVSSSATGYDDGEWHNVIGVVDRSAETIKVYVDNTEPENFDSLTGHNDISNSALFRMGDGDVVLPSSSLKEMKGQITEFAIWETVLTSQEREILYNSRLKRIPLQIQPSTLIGYWPLDDHPDGQSADGVTFKDLSGNGNDGTGNDGSNNTGLTSKAEENLSYPTNY